MPPRPDKKKNAGELRRSQISTTYGSGALIDLPKFSGIVAGIDDWPMGLLPPEAKIIEQNLQELLHTNCFYQVSSPEVEKGETPFSIPAHRFPSWYYCPECHSLAYWNKLALPSSGSGNNVGDLYCNTCSDGDHRIKLIPSRFVVACLNGHIGEFPYIWWVHRNHGFCQSPKLYLIHKGSIGGLERIHISCQCGAEETLANCLDGDALKGYHCKGYEPWLGTSDDRKTWYRDPKPCNATPRVLQRNASNIYYPVNVSALTIPSWDEELSKVLTEDASIFETTFSMCEDPNMREGMLRNLFTIKSPRYGNDVNLFLEAVNRQFGDDKEQVTVQSLRREEYLAFCGPDWDKKNFKTTAIPVPKDFKGLIHQIKQVRKLREVKVLRGFKRIDFADHIDPHERAIRGINRDFAPLYKRSTFWLPAIEMFGEGIFIQFDEAAIEKWESENVSHYEKLGKTYRSNWISNDVLDPEKPRFILLHSFAHLLIRQLTSQCGYSSSSLKEKIYATVPGTSEQMCGVLIYTSTTDTDGSLGGLARESTAERIEDTLYAMLEEASWCSNDPICIESNGQGYGGLNMAACHACALLPETSCEIFNCILDRAAIVGTPDNTDLAYFKTILWRDNNG